MQDEIKSIRQRLENLEQEARALRTSLDRLESLKNASASTPTLSPEILKVPQGASENKKPASRLTDTGFLENILGGNILGKMGILALVLAAGWFIKLAFDERWINESGRIYTGLLAGFLVLGAGLFLAIKKYRILPAPVAGAGFAILYLSLFGAYNYYDLLSLEETFVYLALLSVLIAVLAGFADIQILYLFSLAGAMSAPILLSRGENSYRFLFSYLASVNIGFFILSRWRQWKTSPYFLLLGDVVIYSVWANEHLAESSVSFPLAFLCAIYLIFLARESVFVPQRGKFSLTSSILIVLCAVSFYSLGVWLFHIKHEDLRPHFLLASGALLLPFIWNFQRIGSYSAVNESRSVLWVVFFPFVLSSIADISKGYPYAMAVIVFCGAFSIFSSWNSSKPLLIVSAVLWVSGILYLFFSVGKPYPFRPVFNARFFVFLAAFVSLVLTYLISRKKPAHESIRLFAYAGMIVLIAGSLKEARDFISDAHYRNLVYSYIIAFYSITALTAGFLRSSRSLRFTGIVLAVIVVLKLYCYDIWTMSRVVRIIAGFTLGTALVILSIVYQKYRDKIFDKFRPL